MYTMISLAASVLPRRDSASRTRGAPRGQGAKSWWGVRHLWLASFVLTIGSLGPVAQGGHAAPRSTPNVSVMTTLPAETAPGQSMCPALLPLTPVPAQNAPARRCQEALAQGGQHYVQRTLAAEQACLQMVQRGDLPAPPELAGGVTGLCRGLRFLYSGTFQAPREEPTFQLPRHAPTAQELVAAEADLRASLVAGCSAADLPALHLCAETVQGLQDCVP